MHEFLKLPLIFKQQILNFLENQLCSKLGSLEATCKTLVALEGPAILKDLAAKVDPKIICAKLKLCSASEIKIEVSSSYLVKFKLNPIFNKII